MGTLQELITDDNISITFFEKNLKYFKYNGGDLENLFYCCKLSHSKRALNIKLNMKKKINNIDLENGFKLYL